MISLVQLSRGWAPLQSGDRCKKVWGLARGFFNTFIIDNLTNTSIQYKNKVVWITYLGLSETLAQEMRTGDCGCMGTMHPYITPPLMAQITGRSKKDNKIIINKLCNIFSICRFIKFTRSIFCMASKYIFNIIFLQNTFAACDGSTIILLTLVGVIQ